MATALISLGSNLGDRKATLDAAVERLRATPGVNQVVVSSYHATTAIGGPPGQSAFLNAAARVETTLSPRQLFAEMQRIEQELGRVRDEHWGPRTLDLDLLLYDDLAINEPGLIVPHRFLPFRRFVLEPAVEVAGEMTHPQLGWHIEQMLKHLESKAKGFGVAGEAAEAVASFKQRLAAAAHVSLDAPHRAIFRITGPNAVDLSGDVPTLLLPADDLDRAVREAVAAIQAMQ